MTGTIKDLVATLTHINAGNAHRAKESDVARHLMTVLAIDPLIATALAALLPFPRRLERLGTCSPGKQSPG